ncbi:MAG: hypothetical protein AAGB15_12720 [Pseudomonadota bacterium]
MLRAPILMTALIAWTPAAQADLTVQLKIDGDHAVFEKCTYRFRYNDHGAKFRELDFFYDVFIRDDVHLECTATFTDHLRTTCKGVKGSTTDKHSCADIRKVQAIGAACFDSTVTEVDCGELKLEGPEIFTFD